MFLKRKAQSTREQPKPKRFNYNRSGAHCINRSISSISNRRVKYSHGLIGAGIEGRLTRMQISFPASASLQYLLHSNCHNTKR